MWHEEQEYYDYFTDLTGDFKPFTPLAGLSAAVVTDDEDFYRRRAARGGVCPFAQNERLHPL